MTGCADRHPFDGKCRDCGHVFTVCWLPMPMLDAARLMKAASCPCCAGKHIAVVGSREGLAK